MAELTALITTITTLVSALVVPCALVALWYFRRPITSILHVLPEVLRAASTLEVEFTKEKARVYLEARGAPKLLDSSQNPLAAAPQDATQRLLELRDFYRQHLIELTGAEGAGRRASLRKLALFAVEQKRLDPDRADALIQLEDLAQHAGVGLIPASTAHAIVTVSGTLLDHRPDQPR